MPPCASVVSSPPCSSSPCSRGPRGPRRRRGPRPDRADAAGRPGLRRPADHAGLLLTDAGGTGVPAASVRSSAGSGAPGGRSPRSPPTTPGRPHRRPAEQDAGRQRLPGDVRRRRHDVGGLRVGAGRGRAGPPHQRAAAGRAHAVVDEQSVPIEVTWRAGNGDPVAGPVALYHRLGRLAPGPPGPHRRRRHRALHGHAAHRHPLAGPRRRACLGGGRPQRPARHRQPAARDAGRAARRAPRARS